MLLLGKCNVLVCVVFCLWSSSSSAPVLSNEFLTKEGADMTALTIEASKTGKPFRETWAQSDLTKMYDAFNSAGYEFPNLYAIYRKPEILNMAEIRIIISYCLQGKFYPVLNADCRENGTTGGRYPQSKRILNSALYKLQEYQEMFEDELPELLYRNEPAHLYNGYKQLLETGNMGTTKQFTSTSKHRDTTVDTGGNNERRMIIVFKDPKVGADVDDFSIFDEYEVLLPLSAPYIVKIADIIDEEERVQILGPFKSMHTTTPVTTDIVVESNQDMLMFNMHVVNMCVMLVFLLNIV